MIVRTPVKVFMLTQEGTLPIASQRTCKLLLLAHLRKRTRVCRSIYFACNRLTSINADIAKSNDASVSTRATAAKDAVSDKVDEKKHDNEATLAQKKADL